MLAFDPFCLPSRKHNTRSLTHSLTTTMRTRFFPCLFSIGLRNWQTAREAWCEKTTTNNGNTNNAAVELDVDGVIDVLFDPRWRGGSGVGRARMSLEPPRFPTNVPLPQMIDVLTDLWEAEGLDV